MTNATEHVSGNDVPLTTRSVRVRRLRRLATFVRPHRRQFWANITVTLLFTLVSAVTPLLFRRAIDHGGIGSSSGGHGVDLHVVTFWVCAALAAALGQYVVNFLSIRWSLWSFKVVNDLRTALYEHISRQGLDYLARTRTGVVISRLTNDIEALAQVVNDGVMVVFISFAQLVFIQAFMFALDWRLALVVDAVFPLMLISTLVFRYYSARSYRRTRERMAQVTAYLAESIGGMRVLQAFAAEDRADAEFERTNTHYRRANMETIWQSALYYPWVELLSAAGTVIVLWYGGFLAEQQLVTIGVIFAFQLYLDNFFDPIQQLSQFYGTFLSAMAALDKIMDVMETEPSVVDTADARVLSNVRGRVQFEDVGFRYDVDGPDRLRDVSLDVPAGTSVALVGHTGAGKSTFVKLLTRFHDPTRGRILLDDVDLRDLQQRWLRRNMGIVPQEGFLFSGTVRENIAYGRPDASDAEVHEAAQAVGADAFINELDDGYDTQVGERGSRLSAGQRQLVAFARALLVDPPLLVLDEATSSVDVETELRLADGLRALTAGRTAFIVAHRLSTVRGADLILVVDDGRIVERGTHDSLVAAGGRYADLYGSWSG